MHIEVAAGIIFKDNKIGIAKRPSEQYGDDWEFPGGKMDPTEHGREDARTALVRELKEELGIHATDFQLIAVAANAQHCIYFFAVLNYRGEIQLHEHDDFRFIESADWSKYSLLPLDSWVAEKLAFIL
jgi:8-oxo-dGTP diphosphatase